MSRDEAYTMLRLGRHIERGDMITRVLDVRAGLLTRRAAERADSTTTSMVRACCDRCRPCRCTTGGPSWATVRLR